MGLHKNLSIKNLTFDFGVYFIYINTDLAYISGYLLSVKLVFL